MIDACLKAKLLAGGPTALARAVGKVSSQAVSQWKQVPVGRVLDVEKATGISRHELRPDVFGDKEENAK
ncbi:Cro/CI family transcriptional regulator [Rhizobium sp. LEGMi198b]